MPRFITQPSIALKLVMLGSLATKFVKQWHHFCKTKIVNFNKIIIRLVIICNNYVSSLCLIARSSSLFSIEYRYPNKRK